MRVVHTPSPTRVEKKKINLFEDNTSIEELTALKKSGNNKDRGKKMVRLDSKTHVLLHPKDITPENITNIKNRLNIK